MTHAAVAIASEATLVTTACSSCRYYLLGASDDPKPSVLTPQVAFVFSFPLRSKYMEVHVPPLDTPAAKPPSHDRDAADE